MMKLSDLSLKTKLGRTFFVTWAFLWLEAMIKAFWPLLTFLTLVLGVTLIVPTFVTGQLQGIYILSALLVIWGLWRFRRPRGADVVGRIDQGHPDHPVASLFDTLADENAAAQTNLLWQAHVAQMRTKALRLSWRGARPDMARRDPFALHLTALLVLAVGVLFGSYRSLTEAGVVAPPNVGPASQIWEGWIIPPRHSGRPVLYLMDLMQEDRIEVVEKTVVLLRGVGGDTGTGLSQSIAQDVNETQENVELSITSSGTLGVGTQEPKIWQIVMIPDGAPTIELLDEPTTSYVGEYSLNFRATDDFGVAEARFIASLDLAAVERRHGLVVDPAPRPDLNVTMPLPYSGNRRDFQSLFKDDFSKHPWANLPVKIRLEATDHAGQVGQSEDMPMTLLGRRFFDPLAGALIEQRRDLLWSGQNAKRIAQLLRAISYQGKDLFASEVDGLRLKQVIKRLEKLERLDRLSPEVIDELAETLWALAIALEDGDIENARRRLEEARERLEQAMKNGASENEIARLMQELREATNDYLRMLQKEQAQKREQQQKQNGGQSGEQQQLGANQLQEMMDRIQELMKEGRMAEAMEALRQYQELLENLQIQEAQNGEGGEGEQALEGLSETLREQQDLADDSFRELQEERRRERRQEGQQDGDQQEGQQGQQQGQSQRQGQQQGQGQDQGNAQGTGEGLAERLEDRQRALRDELARQRGELPQTGGESEADAREALRRAEEAMDGAESALGEGDLPEALDRQADAIDELRRGISEFAQAMREQGQQEGEPQQGQNGQTGRDPLGRDGNEGNRGGSERAMRQAEAARRAEELDREIRRRSVEQDRPEIEQEYLDRLIEKF